MHVGKSCKCSFSNWFCLFDNIRLSLAVVHTLREDSDFAIKSQLWKLLTKEDVQNKDRMAVEPITRLCSPAVLKVLSSTKSVVHTLIPDKFRPIDSNVQSWALPIPHLYLPRTQWQILLHGLLSIKQGNKAVFG